MDDDLVHENPGASSGRRAVFLDRDGVLNEPVWNPATGEYESPHTPADLRLCSNIAMPLRRLRERGYELFIVSNQPSYAKGKTSLENIRAIARAVEEQLAAEGVTFQAAYYCYHHPQGIVPDYGGPCACRKPSPYFLMQAAEQYGIDLRRSWMLGDRDSDIECGMRAGCRTIQIAHPHVGDHQGRSDPDFTAGDVGAAAELILADDATGNGQYR